MCEPACSGVRLRLGSPRGKPRRETVPEIAPLNFSLSSAFRGRRTIAWIGAIVLGVGLSSGASRAQIIEKELHRGIADGPVKLDPQFAILPAERTILADLYLGLVTEDAAGEIVPGAAERWEVSDDGLTWTFSLRGNQKWSDGRLLEARDFVYAFQRLLSTRSGAPFASMFYNIVGAEDLHRGQAKDARDLGVRATNNLTLEFRLNRRSPEFLAQLVHHSAYPLRRDLIEGKDESWTRPGKMVSNGAYTLAEWLPGRYLRLAKNWNFTESADVRIDNVYYQVADVPENGIESFFAGEIDTFSGVPREYAADLLRDAPGAMRIYPTLTVDYLVFNTTKAPFDDPRVRRALSLAIDSPTLVKEALRGGEIPADGFLPDGLASLREPARPKRQGPYPAPRPVSAGEKREQAQEILTNAGYGAREAIRLTVHFNLSETHARVAEEVADMWKRIGILTDLYSSDYTVHYGDLGAADFEVARAGWIADFNDPLAFLMLFGSDTERFNYGRFADAEFDKLMTLAARQDPEARAVTLRRAAERVADLAAVIPLYHHASRNLVGRQVTGWQDNLRDIHPSRYLDVLELPPEEMPEMPELRGAEATEDAAIEAEDATTAADEGAAPAAGTSANVEDMPPTAGTLRPPVTEPTTSAPPMPSFRGE